MAWKCPQCGEQNHDDISRCTCGFIDNEQPVVLDKTLATTGQRVGNLLLGSFFQFLFLFVFIFILAVSGYSDFAKNIIGSNPLCLGILVGLLYYIPQEGFSGRSLGKLITGTKAVNEDGAKLTVGQTFGRTLCRFIPFEVFSFFGGNGRPRGWHDRISKTKVILIKH